MTISTGGAIDDMVYRLSHDLRGSTRALHDLPNWVREDMAEEGIDLPPQVSETLAMMQKHADRLNQMIDGLLTHSRVGRNPPETLLASDALKHVIANFKLSEGTKLRYRLQPAFVSIAMCDLQLALKIMMDNALCHGQPVDTSHSQTIAISGRVERESWVLRIRDNGPGVPPQHHLEIFELMKSLHGVREDKGVGMGLAILAKIAACSSGAAFIEPAKPHARGATFCLSLPIASI